MWPVQMWVMKSIKTCGSWVVKFLVLHATPHSLNPMLQALPFSLMLFPAAAFWLWFATFPASHFLSFTSHVIFSSCHSDKWRGGGGRQANQLTTTCRTQSQYVLQPSADDGWPTQSVFCLNFPTRPGVLHKVWCRLSLPDTACVTHVTLH